MREKPGRFLGEVGEHAALGDRAADRLRELLERRLERDALDGAVHHERAFAQHARFASRRKSARCAPRSVSASASGERDERRIEVGRGAQGVRERGEGVWRHLYEWSRDPGAAREGSRRLRRTSSKVNRFRDPGRLKSPVRDG